MERDLYDEFGNYIGPEIDSDYEDEYEELSSPAREESPDLPGVPRRNVVADSDARVVVYHEDKKYYPDAVEVYGHDVEIVVQEEDLQPLTEPIVAPVRKLRFVNTSSDIPETTYSKQYMQDLLLVPELTRNIAICGHLHHGKTTFCDALFEQTHPDLGSSETKELMYTDQLCIEQQRGLTVK